MINDKMVQISESVSIVEESPRSVDYALEFNRLQNPMSKDIDFKKLSAEVKLPDGSTRKVSFYVHESIDSTDNAALTLVAQAAGIPESLEEYCNITQVYDPYTLSNNNRFDMNQNSKPTKKNSLS
jgi:hypothetical protein